MARWSRRLLCAGAVAAVAATACSAGGRESPDHLSDGSATRRASIELEGIEAPVVQTRARVIGVRSLARDPAVRACLERTGASVPKSSAVVRIAALGESVTFRDGTAHGLLGCDGSGGAHERERRWCGVAWGRLFDETLRDPRLDLGGCATGGGEPVAFAWVQPDRRARYVVVRQPGFAELYEPAASLPVRIASGHGLDVALSTATFDVSEHDGTGRLLRAYQLETRVAG